MNTPQTPSRTRSPSTCGGKVGARRLEPVEDLQALLVQRAPWRRRSPASSPICQLTKSMSTAVGRVRRLDADQDDSRWIRALAQRDRRGSRIIRPHVRPTPVVELRGGGLRPRGLSVRPQARAAAAFRLVQGARRVRESADARHSRGRRRRRLGRQPRRGGGVCRDAARRRRRRSSCRPISSPAKIARIRAYGAELVVVGERYADALAASEAWARRPRRAPRARVRPASRPCSARARSAWSSRSRRRLDTVLVAVGGGGLIGGVAAWYAGARQGHRRRARRRADADRGAERPADPSMRRRAASPPTRSRRAASAS